MANPLVSVIMSVYNCEDFLEHSLESVFQQTFDDYEVIVYNDASTDKTYKVVNKYVDKFDGKLFAVPGSPNVGCGEGRNRAIKLAKGKYLAIQDGDDKSREDRFEKEVKFLEEHDVFCVGSYALVIDQHNRWVKHMDYPPEEHDDISKMLFEFVNPIIDPSCMFRRDIFNKLGGYADKWKLVPDFYLWARAIVAGYRLANIPKTLIYYRKHPNGVMELYQREAIREHMDMCRKYIHRKRHR